ncbi:hypothetical protein ROZALSC1DRAFT_26527 [Rozella allomycis CSF55]|uniref:Cell division control protein 24 OB domain-containing protein n=1 Tax=Rozella allomycis (strain CSF55) TaxID=988480 RepID=A0A075B1I2_ROZAC|nr:hypothetical protein O9G_003317 [Rozella allomycis CSF55]RKP22101.1 hypothetical protein ROZALSC1DRAFT_26527 [Rozella allomycis CSF55]|eukprot:EPZ36446.1 hypothetical protein O9G_003317 [Rozella allomycis CSF55]
MKYNPERTFISNIEDSMSHLYLLGQITAISPDMPVIENNEVIHRRVLRIMDTSGQCDVTVWRNLANKVVNTCNVGHLVFLNSVETQKSDNGVLYINIMTLFSVKTRRFPDIPKFKFDLNKIVTRNL